MGMKKKRRERETGRGSIANQAIRCFLVLVLCAYSLFVHPNPVKAQGFDCSAYGSIGLSVVDTKSKTVLFSCHSDSAYAPASLTKLLTALTVLDVLKPTQEITVTKGMLDTVPANSSLAYLKAGEVMSVEKLLYAMLIPSGNDAARVLAISAGRVMLDDKDAASQTALAAFVEAMNLKAKDLGVQNSLFLNPDGFPAPGMVTTADDMILIALAAKENKLIEKVTATSQVILKSSSATHTYSTTNKLLIQSYNEGGISIKSPYYDERVTGMKTGNGGSTDGRMLVFSAQDSDLSIVGVLLHVQEEKLNSTVFAYASQLIDYAFDHYVTLELPQEGDKELIVQVQNAHVFLSKDLQLVSGDLQYISVDKALLADLAVSEESLAGDYGKTSGLTLADDISTGDAVLVRTYQSGDTIVCKVTYYAKSDMNVLRVGDYLMAASPLLVLAVLFLTGRKQLQLLYLKRKLEQKAGQETMPS